MFLGRYRVPSEASVTCFYAPGLTLLSLSICKHGFCTKGLSFADRCLIFHTYHGMECVVPFDYSSVFSMQFLLLGLTDLG